MPAIACIPMHTWTDNIPKLFKEAVKKVGSKLKKQKVISGGSLRGAVTLEHTGSNYSARACSAELA